MNRDWANHIDRTEHALSATHDVSDEREDFVGFE